ncbi:MAG: adenylate/guanylate cyclase domain-containing protein [Chlamydiales bacterium]|nr:adenylate/guanylate cyclase domain-containing protein [Chlamydiales bacterium]
MVSTANKYSIKHIQGIPLRTTIVVFALFMILLGAIGVGITAFFSSKQIVNNLWKVISEEEGKNSINQTVNFFQQATIQSKTTIDLFQDHIINIDNQTQVINYFYTKLQEHPSFQWIFIIQPDGASIAAFRETNVAGIFVWISHPINSKNQEVSLYKYEPGKALQPIKKENAPFHDKSLIYKLTHQHPKGVWSNPYAYKIVKGIGIDYGKAIYVDGIFKGVLVIEYELTELQRFLHTMQKYKTHNMYLLTKNGDILADRTKYYISESLASGLVNIQNSDDDALKSAWQDVKKQSSSKGVIETKTSLGYFDTLPEITNTPWIVMTLISKEEFYAPIQEQTRHSILVAGSICFLCILFSFLFFTHVSKRLKEIANEMYSLSQFHVSTKTFSNTVSTIQEVNMMNSATDQLKHGIQCFAKYTPAELVSQLIQSGKPVTIGGEKKNITVLFVDIVSFTSFSETFPADITMSLLGEYLSSMNEQIESTGGIVDKYIGDGLMALWGAPKTLDNHALCACRAALKMKKKLLALQQKWQKEGKPELRHRMGINTGNAIVGNIGSDTKVEYTAIGGIVNLASRLESINKTYGTEIIVGPDIANPLSKEFLFRPLDFTLLKGEQEPIIIYELICPLEESTSTLTKSIEVYAQALELYKNKKFFDAEKLFDHVSELSGHNDLPSIFMAKKCRTEGLKKGIT